MCVCVVWGREGGKEGGRECVWTRVYVYLYVYVCVFMYVCVCVYLCFELSCTSTFGHINYFDLFYKLLNFEI